ncbi:uncharacterized protein BDR25DRAFT_358877 [Lindgomyces ingoldianus]|uniref:Uncharacterized protein n=1 Tax=Lindgomyces ingoldianus TaxID=673940 RepID=A0ACB6QJZ3_9PLEO|nr:uncharacterized protein BDR25DRAFT_358877 [Lindgomyces ingoldianus]KAF2467339.1 hypothetical protein BDR25DRAFT_358877 [Lindgomyces ingoldianus]
MDKNIQLEGCRCSYLHALFRWAPSALYTPKAASQLLGFALLKWLWNTLWVNRCHGWCLKFHGTFAAQSKAAANMETPSHFIIESPIRTCFATCVSETSRKHHTISTYLVSYPKFTNLAATSPFMPAGVAVEEGQGQTIRVAEFWYEVDGFMPSARWVRHEACFASREACFEEMYILGISCITVDRWRRFAFNREDGDLSEALEQSDNRCLTRDMGVHGADLFAKPPHRASIISMEKVSAGIQSEMLVRFREKCLPRPSVTVLCVIWRFMASLQAIESEQAASSVHEPKNSITTQLLNNQCPSNGINS